VLQKADGVIATVGLEADNPDAPGVAAPAASLRQTFRRPAPKPFRSRELPTRIIPSAPASP